MYQKCGKFFLLTMMIIALGLSINACSESDDPVTPPGGGGNGDGDADTTAPVLVSTTPAPGATRIGINEEITAIFSEILDPGSLNGNITISPGTVTDLILTGNEVQIVHNPFNEGDAISITFAVGITDTSGNHLAEPITNQYYVITDEVQVLGHTPADGATGHLRNVPINIQFNQNMDQTSLEAGITVSVPDKADLPFSIDGMGNSAYDIVLNDDLPAETEVTVTIGTICEGYNSNTLETEVVFSFVTSVEIDDTPPQILSFQPASGSTVSGDNVTLIITFDKPIMDGQLQALRADIHTFLGLTLPGTISSWNENFTALTLVFAPNIPTGVTLTLQLGSFFDNLGNINTDNPTWTVNISGTAHHYPVDERLVYTFQSQETGGRGGDGTFEDMYRNVWSSPDNFMHQDFDYETGEWNEWETMIHTASATQLSGFREINEGTAEDITFNHPVQYLNHPTVPATWSDNIVISMGGGEMNVSFAAEVLDGVDDFIFHMDDVKSMGSSSLFAADKGPGFEIFFPDCRTVIQDIEGSVDREVIFAESDTLVFCPGFGQIRENTLETNSEDDQERYTTSEISRVYIPRKP